MFIVVFFFKSNSIFAGSKPQILKHLGLGVSGATVNFLCLSNKLEVSDMKNIIITRNFVTSSFTALSLFNILSKSVSARSMGVVFGSLSLCGNYLSYQKK
tara:strand:+ start:173 stop:472 length:300 start_codon:yes stop_codon:yes gene_type:complete